MFAQQDILEQLHEFEPTTISVADCVEACLIQHGIRFGATVYGGPLQPLHKSLHLGGRAQCVLARHECGAAMLAEGYYRVARRPALLAITAGPGVANAVNGIALAQAEQSAMVVISAQVARPWFGRGAAQELDATRLLAPITKSSVRLDDANTAWSVLSDAISSSMDGTPGPTHVSVPADLWNVVGSAPVRFETSRAREPVPLQTVSASQLQAVVAWLEQAQRPVVLVGNGVVRANAEPLLLKLAQRFPRLRFACTPRSKGAFPEDHPASLGVFGFAGHARAEHEVFDHADLLLVLGSRLGEITTGGWDPRLARPSIVQIDQDAKVIGKNYPVRLGIQADLAPLLQQLTANASAPPYASTSWSPGHPPASPVPTRAEIELEQVHPAQVVRALNDMLQGEGVVWSDIGNSMAWLVQHLHRTRPGSWHVNLCWGSMGHSLPGAIGGALASGERALVVMGDAAFAMTGFELHTAVEHHLPLLVVVMNDSGHGMVELGSEWQFGPDKVPSARFGQRLDIAGLARSMGANATRVTTLAELGNALSSAWNRAAQANLPHLLDVHIDPRAVPPFGSRMRLLEQNFSGRAQGGAPLENHAKRGAQP